MKIGFQASTRGIGGHRLPLFHLYLFSSLPLDCTIAGKRKGEKRRDVLLSTISKSSDR